ncbi:peptide cleavage/export ABC transporter [Fructilactobacillus frigidiflavus]|uniref:peptide cleavage/export ABC transporter n=1 Tax=Fructilactobacillus frigidiflavus TaxID=3242688 RepID=UPI0037567B24
MKFKYISQVDEQDCGASCLCMITETFGKSISIAKIRGLAKTNLGGTTALGLKKAAEKLDFKVTAAKADESLFKNDDLPFPFIVHVRKEVDNNILEHYYVVYKKSKNYVYIADPDPSVKKIKMKYADFFKEWTGIVIFMTPNAEFKKSKETKNNLISFLPLIFKQRGIVVNIVIASVFITLISIVGSYFIQLLIDDYIPNNMKSTLEIVSIGLIIAYIFQQIMEYVEKYLLIILGQRLSIDLILSYIKHIFTLPMEFFYTRKVGEITSRFNDANKIIDAIASSILSAILDVGIVIIMSFVLLSYNSNMFFISITSIPVYILIICIFAKPLNKLNKESMESGSKLESSIIENISGIETIKALGAEEKSYSKIDTRYVDFLKKSFSTAQLTIIQELIKSFFKLFFEVIILWYGANLVIKNKLSIGELMAYNSLLIYFTNPLQSIIGLQGKIQTALVAAHRLNEIYDIPSEFSSSVQKVTNKELDIYFNDISFEYQYNMPILNDFSLQIKSNEKIALVGFSGSGKSTLAKLLVRFFELDKDSGSILINDTNIKYIEKQSLRNLVTYVPQEPQLFSGTIIENLLLGADENTTFEDVIWATNVANIKDDIEKLSNGFNTIISESGSLSGGQKQRIELARALLKKSKVLVLDELTSNLDLSTEKTIINNLMKLKNKTIIFVAHRIAIAENVNKVAMLDNGKLVALGSHNELLRSNNLYKKLVNK